MQIISKSFLIPYFSKQIFAFFFFLNKATYLLPLRKIQSDDLSGCSNLDAEDESFAAVLFESSSICRRGAMLYPHVGELTVSFNGGKDACVVPWLSFFPNSFGVFSIVKVSGQNCFRTLYGSLGQIGLGPPKGSGEGSTKVPPRFQHQGSTTGVSGSLGAHRLGLLKGSPEGFQGSSKGAPRIHQGSSSFVVSLVLWADPSWAAKRFRLKRFCGRFAKVPPRFHRGFTKIAQVS